MSYEFDEAGLAAWGHRIGEAVAVPVVFALRGDLGAGKSVLARAIAQGAGVATHMPSPTYNLLFEYEMPERVVRHFDLYRLNDESEVWELGWRDMTEGAALVLIEWPERAEALLPEPRWDIRLEPSEKGALHRVVQATPVGEPPAIPEP